MTEFTASNHAGTQQAFATSRTKALCWISFGGNIGDVRATFDAALALLSLHPEIELGTRSGVYATTPMGTQAGFRFLNSVCGLSTALNPQELLGVLQSVETQLGRVRDVRWGPRTIDLDLLSHSDHVVHDPDLIVPHPAIPYRRFVLDPLVEVAPDWCHPVFHETASHMLRRLNLRPLNVCLIDVEPEQSQILANQFGARFPHLKFHCEPSDDDNILRIRTGNGTARCPTAMVDLCHSPGEPLEQLTSALTAIFDAPDRICDW